MGKTTLKIDMAKEHLSESLQQYLQRFGYVKGENEYFELDNIVFSNSGRNAEVTGQVVRDNG